MGKKTYMAKFIFKIMMMFFYSTRHGPEWNFSDPYHSGSQAWNRHVWKHWEEWREDYPWLEVRQTGLGCKVCTEANVKRNAWSKFKACRAVARTICPDLFVAQSALVFR